MANVGNLNVRINVDTTALNSGIQTAQTRIEGLRDRLSNIGHSMTNIGKTMTTSITLPLLALGGASIKLASDMTENINKVDVVFKNNKESIIDWSKTTLNSFGIANVTALDMVSLFGDMATSQGLVTSEAAKMSMSLVGLAGDLASMKNINIEIAQTALKGIFTGETESLKGLGIVMTQANLELFALSKGMKSNIKDMTQAELTNLRYAFVLNATTNSHGDFARTGQGAANQMRVFKETLKELGVMFGETILPIFTEAIKKLNGLLGWFSKLSPTTKTWIMMIAGLAAAIGPLLIVIGTLITATSVLLGLITAISAPIWITIGVIAALVTAGVLLYKNWEKIKEIFIFVWDFIKTKFFEILNAIKTTFINVWDNIVNGFKSRINIMIDYINTLISALNSLKFSFPSWIPGLGGKSFGINIPNIPKLETGTNNVPNDMIAMLHKGEAVVPKKFNDGSMNGNITFNITETQNASATAREVVKILRLQGVRA